MKLRISIAALFVLFFQFTTNAQNYHLDLRMGYSQSTLSSDQSSAIPIKDRQSFGIGLVHTIKPYQSKFGFSIETGYVLKGIRIENESLDYRLHYINAPILFDYYPTEKLKLSIGPELGFLADARNRLTDSTSVGIDDVYDKRWDISGTLSVSYALDFFMDFGVRYNRSFTKFGNLDAVLNRRDQHSEYFQVFLAFKIAN
ncbi:MAG: PorT family protein [Roseivirga sp.]|nr:PorT family protein [Roseivirga sp.]